MVFEPATDPRVMDAAGQAAEVDLPGQESLDWGGSAQQMQPSKGRRPCGG